VQYVYLQKRLRGFRRSKDYQLKCTSLPLLGYLSLSPTNLNLNRFGFMRYYHKKAKARNTI
jgi:hypothetical protein